MRVKITVGGVVQGVGFRPFVARLAEELHIGGSVRNSGGIVTINAYGDEEAMDKFICRLRGISGKLDSELPAGRVERLTVEEISEPEKWTEKNGGKNGMDSSGREIPDSGIGEFRIVESEPQNDWKLPMIPADLPTCAECLREMEDPRNPRFRYPFISCVNCGPRYSILESLPYDRERITMSDFEMCPDCAAEYTQKMNRRRHAQTISCPNCGPQLLFAVRAVGGERSSVGSERGIVAKGQESAPRTAESVRQTERIVYTGEAALENMVRCIGQGGILAVKGIGGYQLVCRPDREETVLRLRELKGRDKKPFAVMFPGLEEIQKNCEVSAEEERLLLDTARPIVLLTPKEKGSGFADSLCSESRFIGAFLPYTGLHFSLTKQCGPLVVTSANRSDDPILTQEEQIEEMWSEFPELLDGIAWNTRRIVTPLDDSLVRVTGGKTQILRRSRGMVPMPISLPEKTNNRCHASRAILMFNKKILAFGGDLKSVFGLAAGNRFYPSQYLGDLGNYRVSRQLETEWERMKRLLGTEPEVLVCDMHPGYVSTKMAADMAEKKKLPILQIQHHHAHAASVMAEHGLEHCLAFVFDGTGYGTDGHVWGGEFLLCHGPEYERIGHLSEVKLCGGNRASTDAQLNAACHLVQIMGDENGDLLQQTSGDGSCCLSQEKMRAGCQSNEVQRKIFNKMDIVRKALKWNVNTETSASMGRLFDAVSALLGIRGENTYEGECAIALENAAARARDKNRSEEEKIEDEANSLTLPSSSLSVVQPPVLSLPVVERDGLLIAERMDLFRQLAQYSGMWENRSQENEWKEQVDQLALGFHEAVAQMVLEVSSRVRSRNGEDCIVLGGGVFANVILQERCRELLETAGFSVYVNEQMPGNDGGICLGQAWIAAQAMRKN